MTLSEVLGRLALAYFGGQLLVSGVAKLVVRDWFRSSLRTSHVLNDRATAAIAQIAPPLEVGLGVLALSGVLPVLALIGVAIFHVVFAGYHLARRTRRTHHRPCGCLPTANTETFGASLAFNVACSTTAVAVAAIVRFPERPALEAVLASVALVTVLLMLTNGRRSQKAADRAAMVRVMEATPTT